MSDLHKFLQDWLDAATGKIEEPAWYDESTGLCACAYYWDRARNRPGANAELQHRLKEEFGETCNYPFGGMDRFDREARDGTMHLNKERLEWVRKVLAEKAENDGPVWGAAIDVEVVRERPGWVKASDICDIKDRGVWTGGCGRFKASEWFWHKDVTQIKLLAGHAYYAVQEYNKEHGTSYTYWGGQGDKPTDWDGSDVVLRNGKTIPSPISWSHPWGEGAEEEFDVIGYTRKAEEARDDLKDFLTEWLECATSDRQRPLWFNRGLGLCHGARDWDAATGRNAHGPLKEKLKEEFTGANLYPFGGLDRYLEEARGKSAHQNPERIAWVRKTLGLTPPSEEEARDDLKDFLTEWLECATSDREGPLWFSRTQGLCQCAWDWDTATGRNAYSPLKKKTRADFPKGLLFPFGGSARYLEDKHDEAAHQSPERLAWVRKTLGLTPPSEDTVAAGDTGDAYGALRGILDEAYNQSAKGKGLERHGNGKAWTEQPILAITRDTGIGFPTGQAIKKVTEAVGMLGRGEGDAAARELLGAIVYTAAAIHFIREQ